MYKFVISFLTLAVILVLALIFSYAYVQKLGDSYYYYNEEDDSHTYVVKDSFSIENGEEELLSYLYHKPTHCIVKVSPTRHNYDYEMQIIGEQKGYALVKDNGYCNVYDPDGKPVLKKDRIYNRDYFHEVTILYPDNLIADYNTGDFFDMQGNPVNNFHTRFNRYYHSHPDRVNVFIFAVIPLIVFLLWYFLIWTPLKKRNTLTIGIKTTFSIIILLLVIFVALFVSIITFMFIDSHHNVETAFNCQYDVKESENEEGENIQKLVWYNPDENVHEVVRESQNTSKNGKKMEIGFSCTDFYIVVEDGDLSNVYGPEGKPIFEKDLENADLVFVSDGLLISDRNSGKYYDLNGKPVKNSYTKTDWFLHKNAEALLLGMIVLFILAGVFIWYRYSWKKRKQLE